MNKKQLFKQVNAKPVYSLLSDTESDQIEEEFLQNSEKSEIPVSRPTEKMSKEKRKKTKVKSRWDSKYFLTIFCFILVLMVNIHLLMKRKGAIAEFFFEPIDQQQQAAYDSNQAANQARQLSNQEFQNSRIQSNIKPSSPVEYESVSLPSCNGVPRKNVVFTKTHKTGGTTLTNIILRYAEKHQLVTGLPFGVHWELAGYPAKFDRTLIDPVLGKYNVLCHHFRYSEEIKEVTYPDHVFITMLRDPVKNFESEFGFFRDYPFPQWVGVNGTLEKFMENPQSYYDRSTPWYFRAKNYMSYDLGLNHEAEDDKYITNAIQELESTYHLVLLTDYFEESLILLKELLCMSFDDLIYLQLKRRSERVEVKDDLAKRIRNWNKLDSAIYDHFLKRFNEKIAAFGTDKMAREVLTLRQKLDNVRDECVAEVDNQREHSWILRNVLRKGSSERCKKMNWGEVRYGDSIRIMQKDWVSLPIQPSFDLREKKLREKQLAILGAEYFNEMDHR